MRDSLVHDLRRFFLGQLSVCIGKPNRVGIRVAGVNAPMNEGEPYFFCHPSGGQVVFEQVGHDWKVGAVHSRLPDGLNREFGGEALALCAVREAVSQVPKGVLFDGASTVANDHLASGLPYNPSAQFIAIP